MRVLTAEQMKQEDRASIESWGMPGAVLMERAALACVETLLEAWPAPGRVLVLAGPGNNGGDGVAMARLLVARGVPATVLLAAAPDRLHGDARLQFDLARALPALGWVFAADAEDARLDAALDAHPVWVDALLGIGTHAPLRDTVRRVLDRAVRARADRRVLAVDLPSGLDTDRSRAWGPVLRADHTVTFHCPKPAHLLPPGVAFTGALRVVDIGIPEHVAGPFVGRWFGRADARRIDAPLAVDGHKRRSGRVWIRAGSETMPGAAVLATRAALRSGAGYVHLVAPPGVRAAALARTPELLGHEVPAPGEPLREPVPDALLVGPGLTVATARDVLDGAASLCASLASGTPVVLDADALTALGERDPGAGGAFAAVRLVLTPHPGELARLVAASAADVRDDLLGATREAALRWGAVVMTRAAGTVVATPEGRVWFVAGGSPGLATAGTGDVQVGLLAGLLARRCGAVARREGAAPAVEDVCALAAWMHAEASRRVEGSAASLTASDVVEALRRVETT